MKVTSATLQKLKLKYKLKTKVRMNMAVRMGVNKDSIKAPEPVEEDLYTLRVEGFKPKLTKAKNSINFQPQFKIVSGDKTGAQFAGKQVFENLNQAAGWIQNDFVHACGMPMDTLEDGSLAMPGAWNGDPTKADADGTLSQLKYGPDKDGKSLLGKQFKAYIVKQQNPDTKKYYNGIKYFVCAVPDCNTKYPEVSHSMNLIR